MNAYSTCVGRRKRCHRSVWRNARRTTGGLRTTLAISSLGTTAEGMGESATSVSPTERACAASCGVSLLKQSSAQHRKVPAKIAIRGLQKRCVLFNEVTVLKELGAPPIPVFFRNGTSDFHVSTPRSK